ncbi:MAG: hypothetical protein SNH99_01900 [Rikenellaceae bacterium]
MGRLKKYNDSIANTIFELLRTDTYTVAEVCRMVKIAPSTYYSWRSTIPSFLEGLKEAESARNEVLAVAAERSLLKRLQGYTVMERCVVTIGTGKFDDTGKEIAKVKEIRDFEKYIQPDTRAIIFVLCNCNPKSWKEKLTNEITGKDEKPLFSDVSDSDLDAKIADYERRVKQ